MPEDRVFLDTNIIVYAYDISAGSKHYKARDILVNLWDSGLGSVSTQVLQEFFVTVTKKIAKPLPVGLAQDIISDFLKWEIVVNSGEDILEAVKLHCRYQCSFWDSLIIQAAVRSGAKLLLSEDLSDGQIIGGMRIKNPFGE